MKRTRTQSPSGTDTDQEARDKIYKRSGQILFQVTEFKAFVGGRMTPRFSEEVDFNGLAWLIELDICYSEELTGAKETAINQHIEISLRYSGDETDMAWTCRAASLFSIVSCNGSGESLMKRGDLDNFELYTAYCTQHNPGWAYTIEEVMDPKNGLYDEKRDAMTFKAEIVVEEPKGMAGVRYDKALLINDQFVNVNKYLLAAHSKFFQTLFFGENAKKSAQIQIDEVPDAVATFKKLIATMYPQNEELDGINLNSLSSFDWR
uniref:BTB domain-containing protein n=1 Tax=Globodera pallida TaxID=36090 RepID=A0A183C565_GLOPA